MGGSLRIPVIDAASRHLWYAKKGLVGTFQINHVHDTGRIVWGYWRRLPWGIHFDASEVGTAGPKCLHLGQPIIQIIHLLSFLSSPLHWEQKLFPLISHKWHRPAQLIIIQPLWPPWLIGMRVHWSICLRISSEAAAAPPPLSEPADSSCGIDRAVCTLRMDAEVELYGGDYLEDLKIPRAEEKARRTRLTSPSGCRRLGRPGSDSICWGSSWGVDTGLAGQQVTPFSFFFSLWEQ